MNQEEILHMLRALPPEAQRQVVDFIASLQARYAGSPAIKAAKPPSLANERFVGMWRDRQDLEDSSAWVRDIRERELIGRRA